MSLCGTRTNTVLPVVLGTLLAASVCYAAPLPESHNRPSLGLMKVTGGEGISEKELGTIESVLLAALDGTQRFKVLGKSDLIAVLDNDKQQRLFGCNDDSCAVELAGAAGVDLLARADVGRLGDLMVITLTVIRLRGTSVVTRPKQTVHSVDELVAAADGLAQQVVIAYNALSTPPPSAGHTTGVAALVIGIGALVAGAAVETAGAITAQKYKGTPATGQSVQSEVNSVNLLGPCGIGLLGSGAAVTITGATLMGVFK